MLTNKRYKDIIRCWKAGYKLSKIAEELGVSQGHALNLFTWIVDIEFFGDRRERRERRD